MPCLVVLRHFLPLSPPFLGCLVVGRQGGAKLAHDKSHWQGYVNHGEEEDDRADGLTEGCLRVDVSVTNGSHGYCSPPARVQDTEGKGGGY